ncbi:MAG: PepSY domain-containing protein [Acidiferrobacterales bacterium]
MNAKQSIIFGGLATAILATAAIYSAQSMGAERNDSAAIRQTKITLTQAISAAEQRVGGKAARAELENENGKLVYRVDVVRDAKTTDVEVDVNNGQVLSAQADEVDHESGDNKEHEGKEEHQD